MGVGFGNIGRRQSGGGILPEDLLEQGGHARRRKRFRGSRGRGFERAQALGILRFILGIETAEDGPAGRIGQMDDAQIPRGVAHAELL